MVRESGSTPLDEFQKHTAADLEQLTRDGAPRVVTVDGRPRFVVQDAEAYGRLVEALDMAEAAAGIRRGMESKARGEGVPMRDALRAFATEEGIDLDESS